MGLFENSTDMAALYKENPKIEAIILAGSVSKNLSIFLALALPVIFTTIFSLIQAKEPKFKEITQKAA